MPDCSQERFAIPRMMFYRRVYRSQGRIRLPLSTDENDAREPTHCGRELHPGSQAQAKPVRGFLRRKDGTVRGFLASRLPSITVVREPRLSVELQPAIKIQVWVFARACSATLSAESDSGSNWLSAISWRSPNGRFPATSGP